MEGEADFMKTEHREYVGEIVEHVVEKLLEKDRKNVAQEVLQVSTVKHSPGSATVPIRNWLREFH
jgi:hypothetical protein